MYHFGKTGLWPRISHNTKMRKLIRLAYPTLVGAVILLSATALPTSAAVTLPPAGDGDTPAFAEGTTQPGKLTPPARGIQVTPSRGQLLYENHCMQCHQSQLYIRDHRKAQSREELYRWVAHWASELKLNWRAEDVNDVAEYLEGRFYRFETQ
jgi:mono/diheme cytochrome c family protein